MRTNNAKNGTASKLEVRDVLKELENSVSQIFTSENYINYLNTYAQFHNYSYNNVIWILMQRPEATRVASYIDWEKKFNRNVKRGSKGIKILVPAPKKVMVEEEIENEDGSKAIEEKEVKRLYFKIGNVFDIADTEGEDLPTLVHKLEYNSDFLKELIGQIVAKSEIPITIADADKGNFGSANGYYMPTTNKIYVRNDLSDLHKLKTIVHELSHALQETEHEAIVKELDRASKEVVAESTAYVVMRMLQNLYGIEEINSAEYSFGYVAGWSSDKELKELKATLGLIATISNALFNWISGIEIQFA